MINSIKELKKELNIKTVTTEWNQDFPLEELGECVKDDKELRESYCTFSKMIKFELGENIKLNQYTVGVISEIAEEFNLMISYFVNDNPDKLELGVLKLFKEKQDWFDLFKSNVTKRQFFNLIHNFSSIIPYKKEFSNSTIYQLVPPKLPIGYTCKTGSIDGQYIYVSFSNEFENPIYKILKIANEGFIEFDPEISINRENFNYVEMRFDDNVFTGDSINTLCEGKEQVKEECISLSVNNKTYTIYSAKGCMDFPNSIENIKGFRRGSNIKIVYLDKYLDGKKKVDYAVLNNGFVWIPEKYEVIDLKKFIDFDLNLFKISSNNNGIILFIDNIVELVSISDFHKFLLEEIL